MDSIDRLWDRIENWLAANAPAMARALKPGVTDEEIRKIEAGMGGLTFPEDVKASYRRHNGYSLGSFLMDQSILHDLSRMFRGQSGWEDRLGYDLTRKPKYLSGPIQPVWWHPAWLTLTGDGAGNHWCIDLAPAAGGQVGQIISFDHEVGPTNVLATSFHELLATFTDQLEAGTYVVAGDNLTKPENIWRPEYRTRGNWERVRECANSSAPMISTRAMIHESSFAESINTLYGEVRASLERQGLQPLIEPAITAYVRYEKKSNHQLVLEVGVVVEEARSYDPRMHVGTFPEGISATLPQICHRRLERMVVSREVMGPADPRLIAEEGFEALEQWSINQQKPLAGPPWITFWVDPKDPQDVPIQETVTDFEVHRLLKK